jgi:hypothetical protein
MDAIEAFVLGMMVAWTPSLLILVWSLLADVEASSEQ